MASSLDLFLPDILPNVNGCPDALARNAVLNALREFFDRTLAWRVMLDPITVTIGISNYDIDVPSGSALSQVLEFYYDGEKVEPTTRTDVAAQDALWRSNPGPIQGWYTENVTTLVLLPEPDFTKSNGVELYVALKPSKDATTVDDWILNEYDEDIAHGALARLCAVPEKFWTNGKLAEYHQEKFNTAIASTAAKAAKGRTRAALRTRVYYSIPMG